MAYLVTGANGNIASRIVDLLAARGFGVHALTRQPLAQTAPQGVRAFLGDLTAQSFDGELFSGVEAAFLFPAEGSLEAFLQAAKAQGVKRIIVLS